MDICTATNNPTGCGHFTVTVIVGCLLALLLTAPAWAQPVTVTKTAEVEEIVVEVNGVKAGFRSNRFGEKWELTHERNPLTLGLTKRLHAHKVGPLPNEKDPIVLPDTLPADAPRDVASDATIVIDVNILYSASAAAARGGVVNMPAFAALACAVATQSAANSGSPTISYRCLGPFQATYQESSGANPLIWMGSTGFTEVNALRTQTGADLSHLITTNNACGQGSLCSGTGNAISQSDQSCTVGNLTFPHETGHNLCMHHNALQGGAPNCGVDGNTAYNCGHRSTDNALSDVLAYGGGRETRFSNPSVPFTGRAEPSGTIWHDNARVLREQAARIAAFRAPVIPPPPTSAPRPPGTPFLKVTL
jgi:hypothetical protein